MIKKISRKIFIPEFDELSFYLMGLTIILLIVCNVNSSIKQFEITESRYLLKTLILLFVLVSGLFYSIVNAFIKRKKSDFEKFVMMYFAIAMNAVSGLYAGAYTLQYTKGWLIVFPLWNIVTSLSLFILMKTKVIDTGNIADKDATIKEVILGTIILSGLFFLFQYYYKQYWALTFSICTAFATNINNLIFKVINIFNSEVKTH